MHPTSKTAKTIDSEFTEAARVFLRDDFLPRLMHCLEQIPESDLWWRPNDVSNSIGNLVLHLSGNIRQWIVAAVGGEDFRRDRDAEFAARGPMPRSELAAILRSSLADVDRVLSGLSAESLLKQHHIQKYDVTGLQAVFHVVEHFSYHLGQILYIYKMRTGTDPGFFRDLSNR